MIRSQVSAIQWIFVVLVQRETPTAWLNSPIFAHVDLRFRQRRSDELDVCTVGTKLLGDRARSRDLAEKPLPDAATAPPRITIVDCLGVPRRGGTSRQRPPVFRIWRMPEMTLRSSTLGLPGALFGRCGSSTDQAPYDSQTVFLPLPHVAPAVDVDR